MQSPLGARRMKTDLHTENTLVHTHFASRASTTTHRHHHHPQHHHIAMATQTSSNSPRRSKIARVAALPLSAGGGDDSGSNSLNANSNRLLKEENFLPDLFLVFCLTIICRVCAKYSYILSFSVQHPVARPCHTSAQPFACPAWARRRPEDDQPPRFGQSALAGQLWSTHAVRSFGRRQQ